MSGKLNRIFIFSIATSLYHASRMFCCSIDQFYLLSLGFDIASLFKLYAFHTAMIFLVNFPISVYADMFEKKKIVFFGLYCVCSKYFFWWALAPLSRSGLHYLCGHIAYISEFIFTLGREIIATALDAWFVSGLGQTERKKEFTEYAHCAQNYTAIFSMFSALVGIALAFWMDFSLCYLISFLSMTLVIGLFSWIAESEEKHEQNKNELKISRSFLFLLNNRSETFYKTCYDLLKRFLSTLKGYYQQFASSLGVLALFSFTYFSFARWITYHFWQAAFFGGIPQNATGLPGHVLPRLIGCTIMMYIGQYFFNRWLKQASTFSNSSYYKRGVVLTLIGSVGGLLLGFSSHRKSFLSLGNKDIYAIICFGALQGAVACAQNLSNNLFVQQTNPAFLAGSLGIVHLFSRGLTAAASLIISKNKGEPMKLFIIPGITLMLFSISFYIWSLFIEKKRKTCAHHVSHIA